MAAGIRLHPRDFDATPEITLSLTAYAAPHPFGTLNLLFGDDEITLFVRAQDCDRLARAAAAFNAAMVDDLSPEIQDAAE